MLALRFYGPGDIMIQNVEKPVCAPGEVLVKVAYAGICGSDLHVYRKGMFVTSTPVTMGHEFAGVVVEVGEGVAAVSPGDHVIGDPRVSCGSCQWCRRGLDNLCPDLGFIGEVSPGCFAEYIVISPEKLLVVPPDLDLRLAALVEPLAVAWHVVQKAGLSANTSVGIVGAGPIGLLTLILAGIAPAGGVTVVDISSSRLDVARKLGADRVLSAFPHQSSDQVDVVVEAAGVKDTLWAAVKWLKPGGRLILAGLYEQKVELDFNEVIAKELSVAGSNAYDIADLRTAIELLSSNRVNVTGIISHVFPLREAEQAFSLLTSRDKRALKVLLAP
ncbi:alcohol dehydrogenase catalytic domain-containing protein [Desulfofundulus thermobenzoicus]|uniref:Alcohol dehydrogenase catalytic domain-containing protein n=1 Tax=Desulfofundulus thermobenzoicus TaxID=29376 RepID=A0A6N7IRT8_9FIRM|nr:alcohol dehydrogenase catalytic domain-containing protein [Desulfofundulus thermobenzoicus]MQL52283.1 alcohol dehydrogenase catalytic domain-containing protein [Desulfofundulus thermobenzoicus]